MAFQNLYFTISVPRPNATGTLSMNTRSVSWTMTNISISAMKVVTGNLTYSWGGSFTPTYHIYGF